MPPFQPTDLEAQLNPAVQNVNLLPKHFRHAAFQPVTNLLQRIERQYFIASPPDKISPVELHRQGQGMNTGSSASLTTKSY